MSLTSKAPLPHIFLYVPGQMGACTPGLWKRVEGGQGGGCRGQARQRLDGGGGVEGWGGGRPGLRRRRPAQCRGEGDAALRRAAPGTTAGMGGGAGGVAALSSSGAGILEAALAGGGAGHRTSPPTPGHRSGVGAAGLGRVLSARRMGPRDRVQSELGSRVGRGR